MTPWFRKFYYSLRSLASMETILRLDICTGNERNDYTVQKYHALLDIAGKQMNRSSWTRSLGTCPISICDKHEQNRWASVLEPQQKRLWVLGVKSRIYHRYIWARKGAFAEGQLQGGANTAADTENISNASCNSVISPFILANGTPPLERVL